MSKTVSKMLVPCCFTFFMAWFPLFFWGTFGWPWPGQVIQVTAIMVENQATKAKEHITCSAFFLRSSKCGTNKAERLSYIYLYLSYLLFKIIYIFIIDMYCLYLTISIFIYVIFLLIMSKYFLGWHIQIYRLAKSQQLDFFYIQLFRLYMCVVELQIDKWFLMQIFICLYRQYFFSTGLFKLTIRAFSLRALLNHMESITNRNLDSNNKRLDLILKVAQRNVWIQPII